jgi:hypothetical protein
MIAGACAWIAKDATMLEPARMSLLIEVGIASFLLVGLLTFAEIQARSSRGVEGFCGSCGDLWRKPPDQPVNLWYQGALRSPRRTGNRGRRGEPDLRRGSA